VRIFGFHDNSACGYYRLTLPLDMLAHQGWDIQTAVGWDERALDYPLVIGQRIGKPEALPLWRKLYPGRKLIYETDDDMWSVDEFNFRARQEHSPSLLDAAAEAIRMARMVTVSTAPLGEVVGQFNPNVVVLPNHVDGRMLDLERPRRDKVVIGWAGGDSHLKDVKVVAPHLRRFLRRHPNTEFHNIGTDFTRVHSIPGRVTGWNDVWDYYRTIDFDIGLAPLAPIRFNRSKSHIKALEYAALGIPTIASDEPPYRDFVLHGVTGYLVRRDHEWLPYLRELANDQALRDSMGRKAKEHAAEYTIQRGWRLWADAYESLM
jgi:glycosyltransferase involved in cell wall biosynthesis